MLVVDYHVVARVGNKQRTPTAAGIRAYTTGKDALTEPEVAILLTSIPNLRDHALLSLAIASGMRREDVVSVELTGVSDNGRVMRVAYHEHKKRRPWKCSISGDAAMTLRRHMNSLQRGERYLFPGRRYSKPKGHSGHMSSKTAYNILQERLKAAGLRHRPFHALRATCIKLCRKRGWTIEETMEHVGDTWRTIQEHYVTPTDEEMDSKAETRPLI